MKKNVLILTDEQLEEVQLAITVYKNLGDDFWSGLSDEEFDRIHRKNPPSYLRPELADKLYHLSILNSFIDDEYEIRHVYEDNGYNINIYNDMIKQFGEVSRACLHTKSFMDWIWENVDIDMIPDLNIQRKIASILCQNNMSEEDKKYCEELQNILSDRMFYNNIIDAQCYIKQI